MRAIQLAVACVAVLVATTVQVKAAIITNDFGLSDPAQMITFDEFVFAANTPITNEYSSLGVTFSPNLFYDSQLGDLPNISGHRLGNFTSTVTVNPFFISFLTVQDQAAFAMVTNPGTSTFTALLGGTEVESFSVSTDASSTTNYFGFMGVSFDTIRVNVGAGGGAMLLDNLQFGSATISAIPEPSSLTLFGIGACVLGLGVARRRRRVRKLEIQEAVKNLHR
jgi:hypothetical protein